MHIWVIELKIGEKWIPFVNSGIIKGVHLTRAEAREAIRDYKATRPYKTSPIFNSLVQYRIRKYETARDVAYLSKKGLFRVCTIA